MTENKEVILSKEYLEKLEDELEYLKTCLLYTSDAADE